MMLGQAARVLDTSLQGADAEFVRVSIDSRTIQSGDLFVAIRGDRFDGHDYLDAACQAGACAAVVSEQVSLPVPTLRVADTRQALGQLAAAWLDQFSLVRVAVTGNAGKTTVKEMMACLFGDGVLATEGNLNNDIGVPLTLFRVNAGTRYGVFELGANAPGEIAWTVSLVKPQVALVTNVTGAHLEGFGSMQGIADAKAEIFSGVAEGGFAVINLDDGFADYFADSARRHGLNLITVSARHDDADLFASDIRVDQDSVAFALHVAGQNISVKVPLPGRHQVSNALMALGALHALQWPLADVVERFAQLAPVKGRMNLIRQGQGLLVDDTYNANPGAVRVVAQWLAERPGNTMLVLGDLAELGGDATGIMQGLGADIRASGVKQLVTVGALAALAAQGFGEGATVAADKQAAAELASAVLADGGTVLVKGSRSAAMEQVVEQVMNTGGQR